MTSNGPQSLGKSTVVPLQSLRLDAFNPRLPASLQGADQEQLAVSLEIGFEAFLVAESIAFHGFFNSEPLIVIPGDEPDTWIVVEGNRRLAALLGLADPKIRAGFPDPDRWEDLATRSAIAPDMEVPVVVVRNRSVVVPIIGFRHISGILQWAPYAQARYVAKLVDEDGLTFAEVAKLIGVDKTKSGNLYRDQAIAKQAQAIGIETGPLESSFSLLTVAMGNVQLREHIGAPLGSKLEPKADPVPPQKRNELKELLTWVFGDGDKQPLISDSREIGLLARVVGSDVGLRAIRAGETLKAAQQKIDDAGADPRDRLLRRLTAGRKALVAAAEDLPAYAEDAEIRTALEEARNAVDALQEMIDGG